MKLTKACFVLPLAIPLLITLANGLPDTATDSLGAAADRRTYVARKRTMQL